MKLLITEQQINRLKLTILNENIEDIDDWYSFKDENFIDILLSIKNKKVVNIRKIKSSQYKRALEEFVKFGFFNRFPVKYVYYWRNITLENIAILSNITELYGHSEGYPYEIIYDVFDVPKEEQDFDFGTVYDMLDEKYNFENYLPSFSNGSPMFSDFGLKPLYNLGAKLITQKKPEDIIITINKILDIVHARSDLAEVFIEGGSNSLDNIAGYERDPQYHVPF